MLERATKLLAASAVLAVLLTACGSDGDDANNSSDGSVAEPAAAEVDLQAFCDAVVSAESAVLAAAEGLPGDDPAPLLDAAEADAPEEIADDLDVVVAAARAALETQDTTGFESDEFTSSDSALDGYIGSNCESQQAAVTAADYAFEVPPTLAAGRVTFEFTNGGEELHEMLLMRIEEEGLGVDDLLSMPEKKAMKKVTFVRAMFAAPGESDTETFDLEAGEYALVCFVPVGSTSFEEAQSAKGPPHALKGMRAQISVQ